MDSAVRSRSLCAQNISTLENNKKNMKLSGVCQTILFPSLFVISVRVNCKNLKLTVYRKFYFSITPGTYLTVRLK